MTDAETIEHLRDTLREIYNATTIEPADLRLPLTAVAFGWRIIGEVKKMADDALTRTKDY